MTNHESAPESSLKRATTKYVPHEDRIRLTGENASGLIVEMWLTQRLLNRMVPPLCGWLERRGGEDLQDFAQKKAVAGMQRQPPVRSLNDADGVLVREIDVETAKAGVLLTFKGASDSAAGQFQLSPRALRQWLSILHDQYVKAGWALGMWPDWIAEVRPSVQPDRTTLLH